MNSLKKKIIFTIAICLSVLLGSFASIFLSGRLKAEDNNDDYTLTIAKVYGDETNFEVIQTNELDNVFMLKNANLKNNNKKEYLLVKFQPKGENTKFINLSVNASLKNNNGTFNISTLEQTSPQTTAIGYEKLFDLENTFKLDVTQPDGKGDKINEFDAQGLYTFTFTYNFEDSEGYVTTNLTTSTSFYLLNEKYYVNPNDTSVPRAIDLNNNLNINSEFTEPRIFNTERIDRKYFTNSQNEYALEQNYFSFTNNNTTDYFGNYTTNNVLLYPTLKYDASRYNVSWTRTIYGINTTYTTELDTTGDFAKIIVTEKNSSGQILNTEEVIDVAILMKEFDGGYYTQYIPTIEFDKIGAYSLKFNFVLNGEVLAADSDNLYVEKENWDIIGSDNLTIFGYQLQHSEYKNENGATEKEMKAFTYAQLSDATEFDRFNAYEYDSQNDIYYSTLDESYVDGKTYFKKQFVTADVTYKNVESGSILGQKINTSSGSIENLEINNTFNESDIQNNIGVVNINSIATTNQAPMFFNYFAELPANSTDNNFYYHFTKSGTTYTKSADKQALTSNSRFTQSGLYVAVLTFAYPSYQYLQGENVQAGGQSRKVQVFVFEILNTEPEISIYSDDKSLLDLNSFTNKEVTIDWSKSLKSPFDVRPNVKVLYVSNYQGNIKLGNDITSTLDSAKYQQGQIVLKNNGRYYVRVDYGPCTFVESQNEYIYAASITYTFVIDAEKIEDIKIYTIEGNKFAELNNYLISKDFTLTYGKLAKEDSIIRDGFKNSGAKISVTYDFLPISTDVLAINSPVDANAKYVSNNAKIESINENVIYNQAKVQSTSGSSILTNDGIYVFNFKDEAGNEAVRYVFKDTTSPVILQKVNDDYSFVPSMSSNDENIVNTDTEIIFGTHKAILIDNEFNAIAESLKENINASDFDVYTNGNTKYLLVKLWNNLETTSRNQYTKRVDGEDINYYLDEYTKIDTDNLVIYYSDNGHAAKSQFADKTETSYTIKAYENGEQIKDNEQLFTILLTDKLGNKVSGKVEMSFDNSALKAYVSGTPIQNRQVIGYNGALNVGGDMQNAGDGAARRLYEGRVSNKKTMYISWIAGEDDFEVASVVAYFYPITFELFDSNNNLNLNFPYSPNPYQTFSLNDNTTEETSGDITVKKSADINMAQNSRFGELATVEGMYEVVRTYKNSAQHDGIRTYYFYIDRNNIISYDESFVAGNSYIGDNIKVLVGDQSNQYVFAGSDFLQEFVTEYVLQTNKQPAKIDVPSYKNNNSEYTYKYYFEKNNELTNDQYQSLMKNSRISNVQLKYEITDLNGRNVSNMDYESNFLISVYDNSFDSFYDPISNQDYYNSILFTFSVDLYPPVANYIDSETGNYLSAASQDSNLSVNNTNVKLIWDNISQNDLLARIDDKTIQIDMILENGTRTTIYKISNGAVSNNVANISNLVGIDVSSNICYINLNQFKDIITKNCRIEITLKYQTLDESIDAIYGNNLSSTKIIYFDFEKPQLNYNSLLNNDKYLTTNGIEQFYDYNSEINFENYAFTVNSSWTLKTPIADTFWQQGILNARTNPNDVYAAWYRVYNKYADESGINEQSIVPGDERYDDSTKAPTRYRFNASLKIDGELIYTEITDEFEQFNFSSLLLQYRYIEIIEMDCAGNYRIYTIYIPESIQGEIGYEIENTDIEGDDKTISNTIYVENNSEHIYSINNKELRITKLDNLGPWLSINIKNGSTNENVVNTVKISPKEINGYMLIDDALTLANSVWKDEDAVGKYFVITITSPLYGDLTIDYHTPGQVYELDLDLRSGILVLKIDQSKYNKITYLTTLNVYEMKDDGDTIVKERLTQDNNGKTIDATYSLENSAITYTFTYNARNVRNLVFEYADNFGQKYSIVQLLGVTQTPFEEMLSFDGNFIENEYFDEQIFSYEDENGIIQQIKIDKSSEYYTNADQIIMEYQPKIYGDIKIWRDGERTQQYEISDETIRNTKELLNLFSQDKSDANEYLHTYNIIFSDTSNRNYLFVVHHYTGISEIKFIDSSNYSHIFDETDAEYEQSISRVVYLEFNEFDSAITYPIQTIVTVSRTYYNENNVRLTQEYGKVNSNFIFNEYGIYTVTAKNDLGTTKTYRFELIKSDATYYSVKANANGRTILLSPSPVKYFYSGNEIDNYVSIYDVTVDINQERNLKVEEMTSGEDIKTRIYHIYSINSSTLKYEKYIAVTKIQTSSDILSESVVKLNEEDVVGTNKYLRTNLESVTLSISPAYFNDRSNLLKINIVYGNTDLGEFASYDENSNILIQFKSAGTYYIYVSDIAGNRHYFSGTPYYTLSLTNNFVYNLNGERGIYNSVFNGSVSLNVTNTEYFVRDNSGNRFTISATLNGESYTPTYNRGSYVFDKYGTYFVTLKGYINEIDEENLVETQIKFLIINPNEAKLMHEYIGLNGYEVTKIEKDGNDITDNIREALNSATLNKFAIYGGHDGIGGNGRYVITVSALIDNIIGEKEFSYSVWINKDTDILILCDLPEGESTTRTITLQMNLYQIYSKVGECKVRLNGNDYITINSETASQNDISTYTLSSNQRYNVTLETNSGNTILSFVVTKVEPLNTIAIIIIVVVVLVVTGLTITFILLRKKMKVR